MRFLASGGRSDKWRGPVDKIDFAEFLEKPGQWEAVVASILSERPVFGASVAHPCGPMLPLPPMPEIDLQGLRRITAETMLDPRTVRRAYGGHPVTLAARASIRKAAEALGLPMPPDPVERRRGAL